MPSKVFNWFMGCKFAGVVWNRDMLVFIHCIEDTVGTLCHHVKLLRLDTLIFFSDRFKFSNWSKHFWIWSLSLHWIRFEVFYDFSDRRLWNCFWFVFIDCRFRNWWIRMVKVEWAKHPIFLRRTICQIRGFNQRI
jgi:hypothetical protein